jgi:zinc/manganese transport system permease protein
VRVGLWNLILYVTLGVGIATAIQSAGSLLSFSYLVIPAIAGVMIARHSWQVMAVAVAIAVTGTLAGIVLSVQWDLPSGPTVVAALCAEAGLVWVAARLKG